MEEKTCFNNSYDPDLDDRLVVEYDVGEVETRVGADSYCVIVQMSRVQKDMWCLTIKA